MKCLIDELYALPESTQMLAGDVRALLTLRANVNAFTR